MSIGSSSGRSIYPARRFWFTVRLARGVTSENQATEQLPVLDGRRVCLVGKPGSSQTALQCSLAERKMQGTSVKNGTDALTLLRGAAAEGRPFDLVILEERLSGGEGAQLAQSMKGDPDLGSIPVIVVTAFGQRGDARAAQEAGVAAYLTRPIHQSALWRCLATLLQAT